MNDHELKELFKKMKYDEPSDIQVARWKKVVRRELDRTPSEWLRLAAACLVGFVIGAAAFKGAGSSEIEEVSEVATIERVYINTD